MLEALAIFLDVGNIIANGLGALDVGSQEVLWRCFLSAVLRRRVLRRRKLPTVSSQDHVREDKQRHAAENDPLPHSEIAPHQVLE